MLAHKTARLGPYQLTECLGRGGMAAVYKAKRRGPGGFEKQVVVKTILPALARKSQFIRMFRQEAKLSAQLQHNNVVQLLDYGIVDETPYLELEYLSGLNLRQLWELALSQKMALPVSVALTIATEVCRGLAYAHSFVDDAGVHRPIIHRDVSPANVMICRDGSVKLLDFGLACLTRGETLAIDTFQGKLAYMSPEQVDKRQIDRRADVFALGALLHELLTGRRLFAGTDDADTVRRMRSLPIDPPSTINREVPSSVDVVVLRALARDPDLRHQSAAEMLTALEELGLLMASRKELLHWLGSVAPSVFTTPCDACGRRLPNGTPCRSCMTIPDGSQDSDSKSVAAVAPLVGTPPPPRQSLPSRVKNRAVAAPPRAQGHWLLRLRLGAMLWWRELDSRFAERRLRARERAVARVRLEAGIVG